jgi:CBS domain-containing protein
MADRDRDEDRFGRGEPRGEHRGQFRGEYEPRFGERGYRDFGRGYGRDYGSERGQYGGFEGRAEERYQPRSDYDRGRFSYEPDYGRRGPLYGGGGERERGDFGRRDFERERMGGRQREEMRREEMRRGRGRGGMHVGDVMTRDPELIDPNSTIREAARRMRAENVGALPVGENDRLVGMVTDRDIVMRAVAEDRPAGVTSVRDVMSKGIFYCFEDDDLESAARCMAEYQVRRLPVLNRDKRLVGIVALADIAHTGDECERMALEGISEPTDEPRRERMELA